MLIKSRFNAAARLVLAVSAVAFSAGASALPYTIGDVFASIGSGQVEVRSQTGVLIQTLNTGLGGFTTGGAFDSAGNFYVTSFSSNVVSKFDNNGALVNASWATGLGSNESIVFDASGNAYIGNADAASIKKVDSSGAQITTYATQQNTDWIDLAADQVTVLYSNEGSTIRELNTSTLVDTVFTTGSYGSLFAKRYLADGSVLAASSTGNLYHWDSNGALIDTIATGIFGGVFALNLDPDGTSVWTGATGGTAVKKLDIATGNTLQSWSTSGGQLFGLAVYGEITTGNPLPNDTPEPSIYLLFGVGLFALALSKRRQRDAT